MTFAILGDARRFASDFGYAAVALCIISREEAFDYMAGTESHLWYSWQTAQSNKVLSSLVKSSSTRAGHEHVSDWWSKECMYGAAEKHGKTEAVIHKHKTYRETHDDGF